MSIVTLVLQFIVEWIDNLFLAWQDFWHRLLDLFSFETVRDFLIDPTSPVSAVLAVLQQLVSDLVASIPRAIVDTILNNIVYPKDFNTRVVKLNVAADAFVDILLKDGPAALTVGSPIAAAIAKYFSNKGKAFKVLLNPSLERVIGLLGSRVLGIFKNIWLNIFLLLWNVIRNMLTGMAVIIGLVFLAVMFKKIADDELFDALQQKTPRKWVLTEDEEGDGAIYRREPGGSPP